MRIDRVHTYCPMCVSRCGVVATVEDGTLKKVEVDPDHPNGCVCVKGRAAPQMVYAPERLRSPMKRTRPKGDADPGWVRISWDEAMDLVASRLLEIRAQYGSETVVFGRPAPMGSPSSDYVGFLLRLANAFGSPNLMADTQSCQWHKDQGCIFTYGTGIPPADFEQARCILLWGHNPHVSWAAHSVRISRARKRGAKLIVVDPHRAGVANKADLWLRVRPGSDGALALAMIHVLFEEGLYDQAFARHWTNGPFLVRSDTQQLLTGRDLSASGDPRSFVVWDTNGACTAGYRPDSGYERAGVEASLAGTATLTLANGPTVECQPALELLRQLAAEYAPERSELITWVPAADVRRAARLFATEKPSCYYTLVGVEQHTNAMQTNRAISLFYALTGQLDSPGGNVLFPKPPTNPIMGRDLLPKEKADRRLGLSERPLGPPRNPGYASSFDIYRAILTGEPYRVRALVLFGRNPLLSSGDTLYGRAALERLDFYVQVDLFANPSASYADLLLPACSSWESEAVKPTFDMGEQTSTWTQLRKAVIQPLHESRSDLEIIFDLAQRLGLGDRFWDGDLEAAFNHQLAPSGITVQMLRESPAGIRVPAPTRYRKYAEVDPESGRPRGFQTPSRRVEVYCIPFAEQGYPPLPIYQEPATSPYSRPDLAADYPLILSMSKVTQFCNSGQRQIPMLRKQAPEPFVEIHPDMAAELGIPAGEWVVVETLHGGARFKAKLNPSLDPRVVSTQHGWWQACPALGRPGYDPFSADGSNANLLFSSEDLDPISGAAPHRAHLCRLSRGATRALFVPGRARIPRGRTPACRAT